MKSWLAAALFTCMPFSALAAEDYGLGLLCPRADSQVTFYTENDQQDAAGTLGYEAASGFTVTSDSVKDLKAAGVRTMDKLCDGGMQGLRIDAKRDGWLQAGKLWIPPNQEWDYGDWSDYLRKAAIWKPLAPVALYQGTQDRPEPEKPYGEMPAKMSAEIYPLKFTDDNSFALVLVDESGAFAKGCAGTPTPPRGNLGWMRTAGDAGKPVAVPVHVKGCEAQ